MTDLKKLTASNLKYLLTLLCLDDGGAGVRCVRLADRLGISKPSVHNMMNTFIEMNFISKESYGRVVFTREGREVAERYAEYYTAVSALLKKEIPCITDCSAATYALLASLSEDDLSSLSAGGKQKAAAGQSYASA